MSQERPEASAHWRDENRRPTVLLVDGDPEARYGLHASLGKIGKLRIIEAGTGEQALEALSTRVVDAVVSGVRMPDTDGLHLLDHVRGRENLACMPFLFVTDDDRVATKVAAFERGATDYITKPCAMAEVVARVEAALQRPRALLTGKRRREGTLAGDFSAIAFTDLVHLLQIGQRTGTLALMTPRSLGHLILVEGQIYHATYGSMEGEEAFYRLMFETAGHFEFSPGDIDLLTVRNTIALSPTALLMEGARRFDAWRRDNPDQAEAAAALPDPSAREPVPAASPEILPESRPTGDAAAELLKSVDEEGWPGTLEIVCRERLAGWTAQAAEQGRCHVLLVCDVSWGAEACLALSAGVRPTDLEAALSIDQKALALTWKTAAGAELDVLVLDQQYPGFVLNELRRQPSTLVVAPSGGDWFGLSMLGQNELEAVAGHLRPVRLLGVGDSALEEGLRYMQQRTGLEAEVCCLSPSTESGPGLRLALVECLKLWSGVPDPAGRKES